MAKTVSYVVGAVAVVLGILGFMGGPIFGLFAVDAIHSTLYLLVGAALLVAAAMGSAQTGAKAVGVVVAIVAVLGFIPPATSVLGFIETNMNSSLLQAVVAVVLLGAGFMGGTSSQRAPAMDTPQQGGGMEGPGGGMPNA